MKALYWISDHVFGMIAFVFNFIAGASFMFATFVHRDAARAFLEGVLCGVYRTSPQEFTDLVASVLSFESAEPPEPSQESVFADAPRYETFEEELNATFAKMPQLERERLLSEFEEILAMQRKRSQDRLQAMRDTHEKRKVEEATAAETASAEEAFDETASNA